MYVHHRRDAMRWAWVLGVFVYLYATPGTCKTFVTTYAGASRPSAVRARDLPVFMVDEATPRPVRVLAALRMETVDLPNLTADEGEELAVWKDELRKSAVRLGADAVMGVYDVRRADSAHRTVCALAVAYRDSAEAPDTCGCVIALSLPRLRLALPPGSRADVAKALQARVAVELAQKGYYAFTTPDSLVPGAWPAREAKLTVSGMPAENLFDFTLAEAGPDSAIDTPSRSAQGVVAPEPAHPATAHIVAALISARGDTIWSATVSRPTDPLVDIYFHRPFPRVVTGQTSSVLDMIMNKPVPTAAIDRMYRYLHDMLVAMPGSAGRREDAARGK